MDTILTNSKARHEFHIEETFEASIMQYVSHEVRALATTIRNHSPFAVGVIMPFDSFAATTLRASPTLESV